MSTATFSCVIICYNYGRFLEQAINSCLEQTIDSSSYEILVIDDGSTDETSSICKKYSGRIRVSRTENKGFPASITRALLESRGQYVCFLDADDWWSSDKLAKLQLELWSNPLIIMHPMVEVSEAGEELNRVGSCGNTSSICVERMAALQLLPAVTELFCHPLLELGLGKKLAIPLGYYRIHSKAMTDRSGSGKQSLLLARTAEAVALRLSELTKSPPNWCSSSKQLQRLSRKYSVEAHTKQLEFASETATWSLYLHYGRLLIVNLFLAHELPRFHHFRLLLRPIYWPVRGWLSNYIGISQTNQFK